MSRGKEGIFVLAEVTDPIDQREVGVLPQGKEREDYAQNPGGSLGPVLVFLCLVITANRRLQQPSKSGSLRTMTLQEGRFRGPGQRRK